MHLPNKKGFTLVELLVVISIIAILSIIGITIFTSAQKAGRDAKRRADLDAIAKALEQYKLINGKYPIGLAGSDRSQWINNSTAVADICDNCIHPLGNLVAAGMMREVPRDPGKNANNAGSTCDQDDLYAYSSSNGQTYVLGAVLETSSGSCSCGASNPSADDALIG